MTFLTSKTAAAIAVSLTLAACGTQQTTTTGSAVGVERKQTFSISSEAINTQAAQSYTEMVAQARTKGALNKDAALTARVRGIANRLIAKAPVLRPDSKSWAWEVNVFADNEINAFCFPGGKIGVYSGLISRLNLTDDEIAQVMGHEIAHALREHTREQQSREQGIGLVSGVIGAVGEAYGLSNVGQIASIGADLGFNLPFSRAHETEADQLGIELAARAGYNPDAAVTLWDKMQRVEGGEIPQILSTHPNSGNRQASLRVLAEKVRPLYLAAKKK
ncbi:Beta-barrel assembly-enhancing protease [Ephemeroptericola cinctiostellae]|uniref:Beta-barrel assembly-enhancing protease n=1 Tax=Ephemeroptericola cinctiostellae TaxID=2268024 RepID=A0A345DBD5_9BURK|nr:M48 family metallopeptidase [Ephemeroptericola cinctiostellae]AXF85673.1 Beta-barrel assembly-enhancing protease [Ephemeroptericola cinctiostellae]